MSVVRVAMLALLVACACVSLTHAAEEPSAVPDIDNNEVLPENDVIKARVDEVFGSTPTSFAPETTPIATAEPASSTTPEDVPPPSTTAPPRTPSSLSRFLSDIIQIPIAVLRSVGSLLSNTFSGGQPSAASAASARDASA